MIGLGAVQRVLAGEHAAVHVLGVLAAQSSASSQPELYTHLSTAWQDHQLQRDELMELISQSGEKPVAAAASYAQPNSGTEPPQLTRSALEIEQRCTQLYATAVAGTIDRTRRWMVQALGRSAVRELWFGGSPGDMPGTSGV